MRVEPTNLRRFEPGAPAIAIFPAAAFVVPTRDERRATIAEQLHPIERTPVFNRDVRKGVRGVLRTLAGLRGMIATVLIYRGYGEL